VAEGGCGGALSVGDLGSLHGVGDGSLGFVIPGGVLGISQINQWNWNHNCGSQNLVS
jgi:hypothetical protein